MKKKLAIFTFLFSMTIVTIISPLSFAQANGTPNNSCKIVEILNDVRIWGFVLVIVGIICLAASKISASIGDKTFDFNLREPKGFTNIVFLAIIVVGLLLAVVDYIIFDLLK
jgi:hypothetical protein